MTYLDNKSADGMVTLREQVQCIRDSAIGLLQAPDEYQRDVWYSTLRAHALVLREDWDHEGSTVPFPRPEAP